MSKKKGHKWRQGSKNMVLCIFDIYLKFPILIFWKKKMIKLHLEKNKPETKVPESNVALTIANNEEEMGIGGGSWVRRLWQTG